MNILVINSGSSSLKFGLFAADSCELLARGGVAWKGDSEQAEFRLSGKSFVDANPVEVNHFVDARSHGAAIAVVRQALLDHSLLAAGPASQLAAIGHRVVHGGTMFQDSVLIDERVRAAIAELAELAPLHNPPALAAIEATETAFPGVPQVAVFDTAYFATLPPQAFVYPLPHEWFSNWGVRRFGFHGISHAYCARRAAELLGRELAELRLVICHLGNGCSASAIRHGQPIATTMGFTPLDGLMMGTRPGSLDPGILLHVQRQRGLTIEQLDRALHHESGLLGVSGISSDFRAVNEAAQQGHERAQLALAIYADRIRSTIGALAVTLGGLDALIFTAGVGENSACLRATVATGLECLGLHLDDAGNQEGLADSDLSRPDSLGRILLIKTQEELLIAQETRRLTSRHDTFTEQYGTFQPPAHPPFRTRSPA